MATSLEASLRLRDQFTSVLKKVDSSMQNATKSMQDFKQKVSGPAQAMKRMTSAAADAVSKMNSSLKNGMQTASSVVQSATEKILSNFGNFGNRISSKINLSGLTSKVTQGFNTAANAAKNGTNKISSFLRKSGGAFKQYGSDLKNGFSGIKDSTSQATGSVKSFVAALGLIKAAGAVANTLKSSIDGAIDRFDTLNQFPKMMKAIGFSASDAAKSKDQLIEGIDGLPTTLGDVVSTTQRIATLTRDLDGATNTTISLNNAFLASGSSSDDAARGLEQYVQMLSRGEVDMQSWRSLQETMGTGLYDIATAFGFAGKSAQNDLYDALQDGTITFDRFNKKLIELYNTGTDGAKRALIGSEGIKTSFKNIRTAITNGIEGSIRKIDSLVEKISGKNIAQHFDGVKEKIKGMFAAFNGNDKQKGFLDRLPALVKKISPYIDVLKNGFEDLKEPVGDAFNAIKKSLAELTGSFGSKESVSSFKDFVTGITDGIGKLAKFAEKHSDSIAKLISVLPKLAAAFVGFKIGKGVLSPLINFGKGIGTVIGATGKLGKNLGGAFTGFFKKIPSQKDMPGVDNAGAGSALNPLSSMMNSLTSLVKGASKLALVFGVIKLIEQAAEALKQVDQKVPKDFGGLVLKLGVMGSAIAGMGLLVKTVGRIAQSNPLTAVAGLAAVALISGELMLAAEAMRQVNDKVPDDIGNFASKVANIAIAIGGMTVLVAAVGAFVSSGVGAIVGAAGLLAVAAVAGELMLVSEAIAQMDAKVPDDMSSVKTKIDNIAQTVGYFTSANLGSVFDLFSNAVGVLNTAVVVEGFKKFEDLATGLESFAEIEVPSGVGEKVSQIQEIMDSVAGSNIATLISNAIWSMDLSIVTGAFRKLANIAKVFEEINKVSFSKEAIKTKISDIKDVINYLSDGESLFSKIQSVFNSGANTVDFAAALEAFRQLRNVGQVIESIQGITFDKTAVEGVVENIQQVIEALDNGNLADVVGKMIKTAEINEVRNTLNAMKTLVDPIQQLTVDFSVMNSIAAIHNIQRVIEALSDASLSDVIGKMIKTAEVKEVHNTLTALNGLVDPINELNNQTFPTANTIAIINNLAAIIEAMGTATLGQWLGTMVKAAQIGEVGSAISALANLSGPIGELNNTDFSTADSLAKIANVKRIMEELNNLPDATGSGGLQAMVAGYQSLITEIQASIAALSQIDLSFATSMSNMKDTSVTTMTEINTSLNGGMAAFNAAIVNGLSTSTASANAGRNQIVQAFNGMSGQLQRAGYFAMSGLAAGIQAGAGAAISAAESVANRVSAAVKSAMKIHSPSRVMMGIGEFISAGLAKGILTAQNLVSTASSALAGAAIPNQLATVSANGDVSSNLKFEPSEVESFKRSGGSGSDNSDHRVYNIEVSINVDNTDGEPIDEDALADKTAKKIIEALDSDLS